MELFVSKIQNFWFYYKKHLLIALAVLLAGGYLAWQNVRRPEPDYHIGLVMTLPCSEAQLQTWESRFAEAGNDCNGDGQVLVKIHTYFVDLADDSPNAGVTNAQTVSALDADLIGKVSGMYLLEDVDTFRQITGQILSDVRLPFDAGLTLVPRSDAQSIYQELFNRLS